MKDKEKRIYQLENLEVRPADGDGPRQIVGYAAVFNARSHNLGGFVEEIAPGAFTNTLAAKPDVRATIDHRGGLATIGRTRNETLRLFEDENGLRVVITPPDTQAGRDAMTLVEQGYVNQMSFMFMVPENGDDWLRIDEETVLRRLLEIDLEDGDVTLATYPAYPQTSAEARSRASEFIDAGSDAGEGGEGQEADPQPGNDDSTQERLSVMAWRLKLAELDIE